MNMIYGVVTTANIKGDGTYTLNVESSISDIEYRNCSYLIQPGINTFPKIGDTVLVSVVMQGAYTVMGVVADSIKDNGITIANENIKLLGANINANGEDLTTDER